MRIARVKISNYRAIKSLTFHPSQHTVLIGQLNSGKSTLLNALALVLDPDSSRRVQVVDEMDFYGRITVADDGQPRLLDIETTLAGCSEAEKSIFLDYWEPWDDKAKQLVTDAANIGILDDRRYQFALRMAFRATYDPTEDEIAYFWYYPKFSFLNGSTEYQHCPRTYRDKVGFFLIPAERNVGKALSFSRFSALDKALRADKINLDSQLRQIVEQVKGKGEILFENADFSKLIEEMEQQVDSLLHLHPDTKRKIHFELSDLGQYSVMNILRAFIAVANEDQPYPIGNQGTGAKQILVLAALRMLSKRRQSTILAVEEPEIGLHPHIQRAMVDDLLHAANQTFITTHSVHVAQAATEEHVFCLLDKGGGERQIVPVTASASYGCSPETVRATAQLSGHYPTDSLDALFAPSVLLTEGVGDRQAVPVLLRKLSHLPNATDKDLDGLGIAIVPCQSKSSMAKAAPYFKTQLCKRVYALVDSEPTTVAENPKIAAACDCTFFWPERHAIEKVLLMNAGDATVDAFIERVTTEFGDDYFVNARSKTKPPVGKREDVLAYLKHKKTNHRLFAELLPPDEVAPPVMQLLRELNSFTRGESSSKEVPLGP